MLILFIKEFVKDVGLTDICGNGLGLGLGQKMM